MKMEIDPMNDGLEAGELVLKPVDMKMRHY